MVKVGVVHERSHERQCEKPCDGGRMEMILLTVVSVSPEFVFEDLDVAAYSNLVCVSRYLRDMLPLIVVGNRCSTGICSNECSLKCSSEGSRECSLKCLFKCSRPGSSYCPLNEHSAVSRMLSMYQTLHVGTGAFVRRRMRALRRIHNVFLQGAQWTPLCLPVLRGTQNYPEVRAAFKRLCVDLVFSFPWVDGHGEGLLFRLRRLSEDVKLVSDALARENEAAADARIDTRDVTFGGMGCYKQQTRLYLSVYLEGLNNSLYAGDVCSDSTFKRHALLDVAVAFRMAYRWVHCVPLPLLPQHVDRTETRVFDVKTWPFVLLVILETLYQELVIFIAEYKRVWYLIKLTRHALCAAS